MTSRRPRPGRDTLTETVSHRRLIRQRRVGAGQQRVKADAVERGQLRERLGLDPAPAGLVVAQAVLRPAAVGLLLNLRPRQAAIQAGHPELAAELPAEVVAVHRELLLVVLALSPLAIAPWWCGASAAPLPKPAPRLRRALAGRSRRTRAHSCRSARLESRTAFPQAQACQVRVCRRDMAKGEGRAAPPWHVEMGAT